MRKFSSEFGHNYGSYSFGYAHYCIREKNDKLSEIYSQGFLPYSGSLGAKNIFYMARSARVPLDHLDFTSENRRVAKKFDGHFKKTIEKISEFNIDEPVFVNFCLEYFAKRHGPEIMPEERLITVLKSGIVTHIVTYRNRIDPVAFVFEVSDDEMTHFWFSFYDLSLVHQSLGMWLMLDSARQAQENGARYFYTGTVYGQKALYKTAFKNIEYWDGHEWISNIKQIKQLGREDGSRSTGLTDLWKKNQKSFKR